MSEPIVVRARGESEVHAALRIEVGTFGPWATNAYLVWDGHSTDALVVDPGMGAAEPLVARAAELRLRLHVVANSHGHIDHVFDNAALSAATGAPIAIHPADEHRLAGGAVSGFTLAPSTASQHLREPGHLRIGDLHFDVLHTPGHTEGSVCLYEERHGLLLTGDTLFRGSWGRTDLAGGDDALMAESLTRLAAGIPATVRVLPLHGPETTIGNELPWLDRIRRTGRLLIP